MDDPKDLISIFHMQEELNRLFRDLLAEEVFFDRVDFPVVDAIETDDSIRIEIEIPGLEKDDITLQLSGNTLVMEGKKVDAEESGRVRYICMERRFGHFRRAISLPALADTSKIEALHENGVLTITFMKISDRRRGAIKIEVE